MVQGLKVKMKKVKRYVMCYQHRAPCLRTLQFHLVAVLVRKTGLSISEVAKRLGYSRREVHRWLSGEIKPKRLVLEALNRLVSKRDT